MLKKDYLSLFYNLLFLSIHTCTLQHTHKSSRFHQSKGRLREREPKCSLGKQQYEGEREGGTHQAAHNERLASGNKYVHQHFPFLLSTPTFRNISMFFQLGKFHSIYSLPKLDSMCSYVLANKTAATSLQLLKHDKNSFQCCGCTSQSHRHAFYSVFVV